MKKTTNRLLAFFLAVMMLAAFSPLAFAEDGEEPQPEPTDFITVNSDLFEGTLAEAIAAAGPGGTVGIHGRVETLPVGLLGTDGAVEINDVTIQGETEGATLILPALYFDLNDSKLDVLTISGSDVTIRNLTVDAFYKIDFAIRMLPGATNVMIDNVIARRGVRGAINVLSSSGITIMNTQANDSMQGGFYFDNIENGSGITFTNCTTSGNSRGGVLVRNAYGPVMNLNLSGIQCLENIFCIEDRIEGLVSGGPRAEIQMIAVPKDANGEPFDTEKALFFRVESAYQHIRYGVSDYDILDARAYISADRYGVETDIYYKSLHEAQGDLREGEELSELSLLQMFLNRIMKFIEIIKNAIYG